MLFRCQFEENSWTVLQGCRVNENGSLSILFRYRELLTAFAVEAEGEEFEAAGRACQLELELSATEKGGWMA